MYTYLKHKRIMGILWGLALLGAVLVCAGILLPPSIPAFSRIKAQYQSSEARLLDRHGNIIHKLRVDPHIRRMEWVRLHEVSPVFLQILVHAEDRRFYRHTGVDWTALAGNLSHPGRMRGASTITMQMAGMLDARIYPKRQRRSWRQKLGQIRFANALERKWTKNEILEAYLNLISFRGELQGITAASRGIFGKEPSGINSKEALVLAALIPSNNRGVERIAKTAQALAHDLEIAIPRDELYPFVQEQLGKPYHVRAQVCLAPFVAHRLLNRNTSVVQSTLDAQLQAFVQDVLTRQIDSLQNRNVQDGAVLVVENASGDILAYTGNTGARASAAWVDGICAQRQAGSSLKPFLYGLALEKGILTAASILMDEPLRITTGNGLYMPENYSNTYLGPVSVRTALASSLNIPAVKTLQLAGLDEFIERLKALGFSTIIKDAEYYGYSSALGSIDIKLFDLVNAYRSLANGGRCSPLRLKAAEKICPPVPVMDPKAVYIINSILSDRESRAATFGLENHLSTRYWSAVKTGTSKDMRDNWCCGFSRRFTVGVWVGNFSGEPMWNVSGVSGAAPVWLCIMNYLHKNIGSETPAPPDGVIRRKLAFAGNTEAMRYEWFITGSEPLETIIATNRHISPSIIYPVPGSIIALDPDIPPDHQKVAFQADFIPHGCRWYLNGKPAGEKNPQLWNPRPGKYVLSLLEGGKHSLASVSFSVK